MKVNQILNLYYLFNRHTLERVIFNQAMGIVDSFVSLLFLSPSYHLQVIHVMWIDYWVRKFHVDINKCSTWFT